MVLSQRKVTSNVFLNMSLFRIVYILSLFFASVHFLCIPAVVVSYVAMAWGLALIYFYYIKCQRVAQVQYSRWILAFLGSTVLTAFIHILDNFLPNMLMLCQAAICFFSFYGMHTERNKKRVRNELRFVSAFIVIVSYIINLIGIAMVFITGKIKIPELKIDVFGQTFLLMEKGSMVIYENRFTGLYTNPNLLAFYAVVAIFCAHMLLKKSLLNKKGESSLPRWLLISSIIFNIFCLFLSDSNASLVLFAVYIIGNIIYRVFKATAELTPKRIVIKTLAVFGSMVVIAGSLIILRPIANAGFSAIVASSQFSFQTPKEVTEQIKEAPLTFQHINKDPQKIDSGRKQLFIEGMELLEEYPLFGIGKGNLLGYGKRYIEGGLHFNDLHNGYLTILICTGIVGFAFFIGFAFKVARQCIKSLFFEKKDLTKSVFPCLFAFILAYCIYAVSEKTLLYEQTFMVVFFWFVLGHMSCYMRKYDHLADKFNLTEIFIKKESLKPDFADEPTEEQDL